MGDEIENPWNISIELNQEIDEEIKKQISKIINLYVKNHNNITEEIVNGNIKLNSY